MVFPKDRRLLVYPLLVMYFVLLWTESQIILFHYILLYSILLYSFLFYFILFLPLQSLNGATHVGTLIGTYPSGRSRSLSELLLSSNDSIFVEKQHTNGNHHTSRNGHSSNNQKSNSHGEIHAWGNWSDASLLDRSDVNLLDRSNDSLFDGSNESLFDWSNDSLFDRSNDSLFDGSDMGNGREPCIQERYGGYPHQTYRRCPPQRYGSYPQQSHEAHARQYSGTAYPNWRNRILDKYRPMLPYGCAIEDISKDFTDEYILNMPETLFIRTSKRKAFILYFYNGIYLERKYYAMVNNLNRWFSSVAEAHNLPDDYKLEWWEECKKELLHDLECIQRTCESFFWNFITKGRKEYVWTIPFENLLHRLRNLTNGSINRNKEKWTNILAQKMRSNRASASRKYITQQR
ncbi:Uncharacterized protein PCOAH_00015450 [Plasmodium coatneyi]|uniref:Plasmodium RESA N-terminal domain-containing protein n=1 Tax=Plasmodium coatneyi TaxID=208452 RepID=A0A1B1DXK6_9APIC|nr:Uncharacterized protein PCOAH_00015450 [Plasmodium coatneyi]ANQ07325.1 Uncharacterized protein PCOAH_00015450 [Plasmodium coatneyi]